MNRHIRVAASIVLACLAPSLAHAANGDQQMADLGTCTASGNGESAEIRNCTIGYRTFGTLNADGTNAVLVPAWYGGKAEDASFFAAADYIDPEKFFIIAVDPLGNGVSSSPSNSVSQTGPAFPAFTIADMVETEHRLLTEVLGIEQLHAIVGLSMGGMQAFEWATRHPGFARKTLIISGSPRLPAFDRNTWQASILLLEWWLDCHCEEAARTRARVNLLSTVPGKLEEDYPDSSFESAIEDRVARAKIEDGAALDAIYQAQAMIAHDISASFQGDMQAAASATDTEWMIFLGADDRIVTIDTAIAFASLVGVEPIIADHDCGHNEAMCAGEEFAGQMRRFLDSGQN